MAIKKSAARREKSLRRSKGSKHGFQKTMGPFTLLLLTLGGVMGSGLFLASGLAIRAAGPAVLGLFILGLFAMYLEITALGEMSAATPAPGSFLVYARKVIGPGFTFVVGWIFWFSSVLTMSSEVTAASLFTQYWFPQIPLWSWSLAYAVVIVAINFVSVRGFSMVENAMAGIKVTAVLAFVVAALWALWGRRSVAHYTLGTSHLTWSNAFPHGWTGLAAAMVLVLFSYAGTGVIGLAAPETRNPHQTIKQATIGSVLLAIVLYLGAIWGILSLIPWTRVPTHHSPFVMALHAFGAPWAASVMNLVLLFAVLSTMNAALYSNVRVLYSLAHQGEAPRFLGKLNGKGLPSNAIFASSGLLALTIGLAYALPAKAYSYLVTATGFQAMFIWLAVLLTHLRYRPYLLKEQPDKLGFRLWGYPATSWFVIVVVVLSMAGAFFAPSELVGAIVGFSGIVAATIVWFVVKGRMVRVVRS